MHMNLLISGKSRELIITAAAASGKLLNYAQRFVKFNHVIRLIYNLIKGFRLYGKINPNHKGSKWHSTMAPISGATPVI